MSAFLATCLAEEQTLQVQVVDIPIDWSAFLTILAGLALMTVLALLVVIFFFRRRAPQDR